MLPPLTADKNSIVVLYKGGRIPAWEDLSNSQKHAYSQEHVDLMLSVATQHRLQHLEGFKLLTAQGDWQRFWTIEFPTLEGAEAWIDAEMAPPYGRYGHYEYYLARRWASEFFSTWVTSPLPAIQVPPDADPHHTPPLAVDRSSMVAILFARMHPEAGDVSPVARGDSQHVALMQSIAKEHGLMRLEGFKLITPQNDWHRAWIVEFPTLAGVEAWLDGEAQAPYGRYSARSFHLARKWAPDYFASWIPRSKGTL